MKKSLVAVTALVASLAATPVEARFLQTDPIGYDDQMNLYAYVGNDPVNATDPTGEACVAANGWSDYCRRAALYSRLDGKFAGQTRFYGAAAATTAMLANLSMPGFGQAMVSNSTRQFMSDMSSSLEAMNMRMAKSLEGGAMNGANLDLKFIHAEQTAVQGHLDAFNARDPSAYASMIAEVNGLLNPSGVKEGMANFYGTDRAYQRVLDGVRNDVGGEIDFANQGHREAIGKALVKELRDSGACDKAGSRIKSC